METSYTIEDKELLKRVGERIRHFRIEAGLSQEKLSFECNLDRTYIGSVERGERNIAVINLNKLAKKLNCLVGTKFQLTRKTRTDGSNIRKLVASTLEQTPLPVAAEKDEYEIMPPKGKGIPKITREFVDTYIVTSGTTYNLQVWNRIPASKTLLIKLEGNGSLKCNDVRFVFVRIDIEKSVKY